jgi:hypothetical protein
MGSRDDRFLDDERGDARMLQLLARMGEPIQADLPPDIVTRTARRLPSDPPALAARRAARRRATRLALTGIVLGAVALVALVSIASMASSEPRVALLFGDGGSGLSRTLLMLYLLAKPIVRMLSVIGAPLLLAGALAFIAGGWLWRWLLWPARIYAYAENQS